jgi:hypothetical protein
MIAGVGLRHTGWHARKPNVIISYFSAAAYVLLHHMTKLMISLTPPNLGEVCFFPAPQLLVENHHASGLDLVGNYIVQSTS